MPEQDELKRSQSIALKYLSRRDHTRKEVENHLAKKGFSPSIIGRSLEYLSGLNYVNDERFAMNWGRYRLESKKFWKRRIQHELLAKGIDKGIIENTIQQIYNDVDELKLAQSCIGKKLSSLDGLETNKKKQRIAQWLHGKGFGGEAIFQTLENLFPHN
jgi:regulatory protein